MSQTSGELPLTNLPGYDSPEKLHLELNTARNMLQTAEHEPLRIGVSFLVWQLEKDPSMAKNLLSIAIGQHVQAIWLAFGEDLGYWIRSIRADDPNAANRNAVKIFVQISTVEQAVQAVKEWKADVIVVQGPRLCHSVIVKILRLNSAIQGMKQEDTVLGTAFHFSHYSLFFWKR